MNNNIIQMYLIKPSVLNISTCPTIAPIEKASGNDKAEQIINVMLIILNFTIYPSFLICQSRYWTSISRCY